MPSPLDKARSGARAVAMGAYTATMLQGVQLRMRSVPEDRRYLTYQRWMRRWCRGLLGVFGVDHALVGPAPEAARGPRLIVANHRSPLDIILTLSHFGGHVLSRSDLAGWPILGAAARSADTIFVDRDDPKSGVKAIRQIRKRLRAGRSVIVFPEGTTFQGDEVRPFVGGAFAAVRGLEAELLPVGIAYQAGSEFWQESFVEHIGRVAARPQTRVRLCVGEPLKAGGDREQMAASMRERVQVLVTEARRHV